MEKYRVHEVAKDFGLPTKDIMEILTKYAQAPKNHMQALTDAELSVIFDYLTEKNPVSGIQVIFADTAKEEEKKAETTGLLVTQASGPAAKAGIRAGDILVSADGKLLKSRDDLLEQCKDNKVLLLVQRNGGRIFIPVKLQAKK